MVHVFGCGYVGEAVARLASARGIRLVAAARSDARVARLRSLGIDVATDVSPGAHVLVAFPPDGSSDAALAVHLNGAASITYISSTAVYGDGDVNDATPVVAPSARLAAEDVWRAAGATVLRCPAIYGPDRGLHVRVVRGDHRIAGDGSMFTSRIHVDDVAQLVLAAGQVRGRTFVVGDLEPATQREVAEWIAREYGVAVPPSVPLEEVPQTLRANRRVDGTNALAALGVTLLYPSYRDGMKRGDR